MITVKFFTLLRLHLKLHQVELDDSGGTVTEVLNQTQARVGTPFLAKLIDGDGELKRGTIILINGANIVHLDGLATEVRDEDVVSLFPPGGGG
jgi:molybdopterin synthase sulfur carrier subunit